VRSAALANGASAITHISAGEVFEALSARHSILQNAQEELAGVMAKRTRPLLGRSLDRSRAGSKKTRPTVITSRRSSLGSLTQNSVTLRDHVPFWQRKLRWRKQAEQAGSRLTTSFRTLAGRRKTGEAPSRSRSSWGLSSITTAGASPPGPWKKFRLFLRSTSIQYSPDPDKGRPFLSGNSAARVNFSEISTEPVDSWSTNFPTRNRLGRMALPGFMPEFGYERG